MDQKIEIKLKLLDNSVHKIQANLTDTIKYLKEQIEKVIFKKKKKSYSIIIYNIIFINKIIKIKRFYIFHSKNKG